jgi:para-nitrobenzyl esterase
MKSSITTIVWTLLVMIAGACGGSDGGAPASAPTAVSASPAAGESPAGGTSAANGACVAVPATGPGTVATRYGTVRGHTAGGTWAFQGIPFAAPPTGALRWRPPVTPECWAGVREAAAFPPPCLQMNPTRGVIGSEDCLYLNIWTPSSATPESLPVMVFIHGGGNMSGSTSEMPVPGVPTYDGQALAERGNVVVVTVQYRLNTFGYFVHPALDSESPAGTSGNYGLMDQLAALRWVQDTIRAFGGDPARVILFGESGGATDVCALYASPLAAGLFRAALVESGGCGGLPKSQVQEWSAKTVAKTSCAAAPEVLTCLRALDGASLVKAMDSTTVDQNGRVVTPTGPTIDGDVLPDSPLALMSRGQQSHVPFIVGTNASETASPIFRLPATVSAAQYEQFVRNLFPSQANQVLAEYPLADYPSGRDALVAVTTDFQFTCPARTYARAAASNQSEPVYRYFYTQVMQGGAAQTAAIGATHGYELFFVFQHLQALPTYRPTASDTALEAAMLGFWTSLAAAGEPNAAGGSVAWPAYDTKTDSYIDLGTPVVAGAGVRTAKCDFWDALRGR